MYELTSFCQMIPDNNQVYKEVRGEKGEMGEKNGGRMAGNLRAKESLTAFDSRSVATRVERKSMVM